MNYISFKILYFKMKLTELLYPYDEVIMSLIQSILKKNFEESLYWAWELIYSGEDIIYILNEIFLDFYAVYNPYLERLLNKLNKLYKLYSNNNCIANIIYNFINSKASIYVFKYKNNLDYKPKYIYKKKEWIKQFPNIFHPLILSIKNKNYNNISYYLRICCHKYGSELTHLNIIKYFEFLNKNCDTDEIIKYWNNRYSNDDFHILLSLIFSILQNKNMDNAINYENIDCNCDYECECYFDNKNLFKFIETPLVEKLNKHYYSIHKNLNYLKLHNRLYSTHNTLGPNNYDRYKYDNINDIYDNYLYYTTNTPSWIKRLDKYNISFDDNKNIICNEDLLDLFNENYDYEFDEQPLYIKNMSNHNINVINNYDKWFHSIYNTLNIILIIDEY